MSDRPLVAVPGAERTIRTKSPFRGISSLAWICWISHRTELSCRPVVVATSRPGAFHAAEQVRAAVDAAYGENDPRGRSQYRLTRQLETYTQRKFGLFGAKVMPATLPVVVY